MNIEKNSVVTIHYTLKDGDNKVIDASNGKEPLVYLHGAGMMIPTLEEALAGRTRGDQFQISIPPEKAYGLRDETRIEKIPAREFQEFHDSEEEGPLEIGMQFEVETDEGPLVLTVLEIGADEITVDANHPLAGQTLNFDVEVTEIRSASAEELEHGHVHGHGGHHHD